MRCRIGFRSGTSAVDEVTCDDEASVAKKTRPGRQSSGVTVLVRLTRTVRRGVKLAGRTRIHLIR